jgi:Tfp pilus assembly pilus retraction ATPase PilT
MSCFGGKELDGAMIDKINRSRRDHIATIEEIIPGSALYAASRSSIAVTVDADERRRVDLEGAGRFRSARRHAHHCF